MVSNFNFSFIFIFNFSRFSGVFPWTWSGLEAVSSDGVVGVL